MNKANLSPQRLLLPVPKRRFTYENLASCSDCKRASALGGYRFRSVKGEFKLVPVCLSCRIEREVQITRNRFKRRQRRYDY